MVRDGPPARPAASLVVLGLGFRSGIVAGVPGPAAGRSETMAALLDSRSARLRTPAVALIPLIVLWFGFETTAKTVVVFLFVFFPVSSTPPGASEESTQN